MDDEIEQEILRLELDLLDAEVRRDPAHLDALISDDFVEFGVSGRVESKQSTLQRLSREPATAARIEDFRVAVLAPDTVLAIYRLRTQGAEAAAEASSLRSSLWRDDLDGWQLVFHQGTPAAE